MNIKTKSENYSNTIFDIVSDRSQKSIFVSIVCYRDENIIRTIQSLSLNAKRPENITVSVSVSAFLNYDHWVEELKKLKFILPITLIINIYEAKETHRFGELKKQSENHYNKEDYYLSISSSSEFDPDWDDILIKQYIEIKNNIPNENIVFTARPRKWLPHDDIIPGYVFYTNHKSKVSMQREEYDGARIPVSGYNEFVRDHHIESDSVEALSYKDIELYDSIGLVRESELFLKKFGFIKFNDRKFTTNEYIASALGFSSDFVFTKAKLFLNKNNSINVFIDEDFYNFYSFINLINNDFSIFSIRWVPIYKIGMEIDKSPRDFYTDDEILQDKSMDIIKKIIEEFRFQHTESRKIAMSYMLSVDWDEKKFKVRSTLVDNHLISCINTYISLYNFSINENSLHWNKRS